MTRKHAAEEAGFIEVDEPDRRWKGAEELAASLRPIADLELDPENAKTHDPFNVATIAASLRDFGQQEALIVRPSGRLVAGEGRILAIQSDPERLPWTHVACVVFRGSERRAKQLALVHNRSNELGSWDPEALAPALLALREQEVSLEALGWRDDDVADLLKLVEGPPSLDELEGEHGEHDPNDSGDMWPVFKIRLPRQLADRFRDALEPLGDTDADRVQAACGMLESAVG